MRINDLEIDGFGVWQDLKLEQLSPRVTAFYGLNEAGKTTVMHFVRSVLYGVSPERRQRYLPPVDGGRPGGVLGIVDGDRQFRASRYADRGDGDVGRVICTEPDGTESGDRLLRDALADVDEATYVNIFAVGLREIQELGALSDTRAAQWLYRLTSGIDRVSLYDVIQELRQKRRRLLGGGDLAQPGELIELASRRDQLRAEIERLVERNRSWSQMSVKLGELDQQIAAAEQHLHDQEHQARTIEIAVGLKENWRRREKIDEELQSLSGRVQLPDDALERLEALNRKIDDHQRQADILQGQRHQLRDESQRLGINDLLVRNAARIDALGEQRDWLEALTRQMDRLKAEADDYERRFSAEQDRLGEALGLSDGSRLREISEEDLENLSPAIESIRVARKKLEAATRHLEDLSESERSLKTQIDSAIVGGQQHKLPMDLGEASDLVAKLRNRLQIEQRIEQARQHELEMEQQSHELLDDQVMPLWLFGWLLAAFVIGSFMLGVWALVPDSPFGQYGGLVALLGVGGAAFSWVFKYFAEDAAADRLDACQRQMEVLARQIADADREKEELDAELPMTDGSVVLRLQAAERHLAELESVLPVEAQRQRAGSEAADAEGRLKQARRELDGRLDEWKSTVAALGLPETLDPQKLVKVTDRYGQLSELEQQARQRRDDAAARTREHATLLRRIRDLSEEVGLSADEEEATDDPLDLLDALLSERRQQQVHVERREELRERAKGLKAEEGKRRRAVAAVTRRRKALFDAADCDDEQAYRLLIADQVQAAKLKRRREAISREITAAIGRHATEETFAELLSLEQIGTLDSRWEKLTDALDAAQNELRELAEKRGALQQQQQTLAEDQSLAERQLDLDIVEHQLAAARHTWREYAAVNRVLERIRAEYEAKRQPETLAEASKYMSKLTAGQYRRVWTPLASDILLVETAEGESLPVEVLSRGTREQLFLSVRLALASTFGRRGVNLPLVLDDVLVNFDAVRAQRAAEVLCEFAAGGRQLLVFTCHEHMWRMFQSLEADCRRLPVRRGQAAVVLPEPPPAEEAPPAVVETPPVEEAPKPKKKRRRPKPKPVVESTPEPASEPPPYEYPFVERVIEEQVMEQPIEPDERPSEASFYDYSFAEKHDRQQAIAYIVNEPTQRRA